jgi:uncharacterized membrane protein YdjX (TVP38/TMEM64 family)
VKKYLTRVIFLAAIVAAVVLIFKFTPVGEWLNLKNLEKNRDALQGFVQRNSVVSVIAYIGIYIVVVALSIPGASILTLLGGFFFGVVLATAYINVGATVGAFLVFLAARFFLGEMIQTKYQDKLVKFNREMEANGKNYLLTLRLIPLFPFWMINLFAGVTKIKTWTFVWTTSLGIIPGSAAYAYAGFAVGDLGKGEGVVPKNLIFAFVALGLLSIIPVVVKKIRKKKAEKNGTPGTTDPVLEESNNR